AAGGIVADPNAFRTAAAQQAGASVAGNLGNIAAYQNAVSALQPGNLSQSLIAKLAPLVEQIQAHQDQVAYQQQQLALDQQKFSYQQQQDKITNADRATR